MLPDFLKMNASDLRELYQEVIIGHNKHPHNRGCLGHCTHQAEGDNPLCGDQVRIYLKIDQSVIENISFEGEGCAISVASASIMTKLLKGKSINIAEKLSLYFQNTCTGNEVLPLEKGVSSLEMEELELLSSAKHFPARVKCATLAWHTFDQALTSAQKK